MTIADSILTGLLRNERQRGRQDVLTVIRSTMTAADADYIESRLREVTTPFAMPGATTGVTGFRPGHAGRTVGGNPGIATETAAAERPDG